MISDLIRDTIRESVGKYICFWNINDFYFEGKILGADSEFMKYQDRVLGVSLFRFEKIKEVKSIK